MQINGQETARNNSLFKYSKKDRALVLLSLGHLLGLIFVAVFWSSISNTLIWISLALHIFMICTSFQVVSHYFIHTPFFKDKRLNFLFSMLNSISLSIPQSIYRVHHLNHHRYNNDPKDVYGTVKDQSSIFKHSHSAGPEGILSYSLLSFFRADFIGMFKKACKHNRLLAVSEIIFFLGIFSAFAFYNFKFFLLFLVLGTYLGSSLASFQNYLEHLHAVPNDRKRDSVSCYNGFYNAIWFNNGYHQEHHLSPGTHWTRLPSVTERLPHPGVRRVVPISHFSNLVIPARSYKIREPG